MRSIIAKIMLLSAVASLTAAQASTNTTQPRDIDLNEAHGDMDMMYSQLYFYMGTKVKYIFNNLETQNAGTYCLALVVTFIIAIMIEGLNFLRYHL
jgi:hypothetical protein